MGAEIDLGPPWMGSQLHVSARTGFSGEAVRIRRVLWSGGPISAQGTMTAASNSAAATVDTRIVRARRTGAQVLAADATAAGDYAAATRARRPQAAAVELGWGFGAAGQVEESG